MTLTSLVGGIVALGRGGCCRDIAGIHRRYGRMNGMVLALRMVGETANRWACGPDCHLTRARNRAPQPQWMPA